MVKRMLDWHQDHPNQLASGSLSHQPLNQSNKHQGMLLGVDENPGYVHGQYIQGVTGNEMHLPALGCQ